MFILYLMINNNNDVFDSANIHKKVFMALAPIKTLPLIRSWKNKGLVLIDFLITSFLSLMQF